MIKKILLLIFIASSLLMTSEEVVPEEVAPKKNWFTSKNTSFGLFDEKFGLDFFSLSLTIYEDGNDEIFVGFGTSIFVSTQAGIGWKRYYDTDRKLKPFSCISMFDRRSNKMAVTNGDSVREDNCIGLSGGASLMLWDRKEDKRDLYLNIGVFAGYDFRNDPFGCPFINLEFKN